MVYKPKNFSYSLHTDPRNEAVYGIPRNFDSDGQGYITLPENEIYKHFKSLFLLACEIKAKNKEKDDQTSNTSQEKESPLLNLRQRVNLGLDKPTGIIKTITPF